MTDFERKFCMCTAPIIFASSSSNRAIVLDFDPSDDGTVALTERAHREPMAQIVGVGRTGYGPLRTEHHATCPKTLKVTDRRAARR